MNKHILTVGSMDINFDDVFGGPPRFAALILSSHSGASSSALAEKGTGRVPSFKNTSCPVFDLPVFGDEASSRSILYDSRANLNVHGRVFDETGPSPDAMVPNLHGGPRSKPSSSSSSRRMSPVHPAFASSDQSARDDRATNKTRPALGRLSKRGSVSSTSSFDESGGNTAENLHPGEAKESCVSSIPFPPSQAGLYQNSPRGVMDGIDIATLQSFVDSDDAFGGYYPQKRYTQLSSVSITSDSNAGTIASTTSGLKILSSLDALGSSDTMEKVLARSSSTKHGREQRDKQVSIASQVDLSGTKQSEPMAGTSSVASHDGNLSHLLTSDSLQSPSSGTPLKYKTWKDLLSEPPAVKSFTSKRTALVVPPSDKMAMGNNTATAFVDRNMNLQAHQEAKEHCTEIEEREMQALLSNAWKYNEQVEREKYNTKFPMPIADISGKRMSHNEDYESEHAHEKNDDANWKEWRKFGQGQTLRNESSAEGLLVGSKMQENKVTREGSMDDVDCVLKFGTSPDELLGLHSEISLQQRDENHAKRHMRGRSDGLRKNASFHGFSSSPAQETFNSNKQIRSQSGTLMRDTDGVLDFTGGFEEIEGEIFEHRKSRWDHYVQARIRKEKALEEMRQQDANVTCEEEEMQRFYETANEKVKRWAAGKETNLRALLSNLQHVLWSESSWQPIPLSELIEVPDVKKAYRKATLFVHPDKMQQKGGTTQQKYIAEKVFDLLQAAWKTFSLQESF